MGVTLEGLSRDLKRTLSAEAIEDCQATVCGLVREALLDDEFVARYLPDRTGDEHPREVLYEDPDIGFCICGHVYEGAAESGPHDHGPSWAIYGQAEGPTEMTDWKIVQTGEGDAATQVEPEPNTPNTRSEEHNV